MMNSANRIPWWIWPLVVLVGLLIITLTSQGQGSSPGDSAQPDPLFPPGVDGILTAEQQAAFERLKTQSREQPYARVENGIVRFIKADMAIPDGEAVEVTDQAMAFLEEYGDLYDITNPTQNFQSVATTTDAQGNHHVAFAQSLHGIPVYGAMLKVHTTPSGEIQSTGGAYVSGSVPPTTPAITAEQAEEISRQTLGVADTPFASPTTLYYFDEALGGGSPSKPRLVWKTTTGSDETPGEWTILVNAETGEVVRQKSSIHFGDREVWDANGQDLVFLPWDFMAGPGPIFKLRSTKVMEESGCVAGEDCIADAWAAYDYSGAYRDFLSQKFGRDGLDGKGSQIKSYVNVGDLVFITLSCQGSGSNAAWLDDEQATYYSNGWVTADIVAHEFTHGLIDHAVKAGESGGESGLVYERESGALNESYADVFGALFDGDWQHGDDLADKDKSPCGAQRDLSDPGACGDYPDHYANFEPLNGAEPDFCDNDLGHVHKNSSIPNKAAFLLSEGGAVQQPDGEVIAVNGIGPEKLGQIYYRTLTEQLHPHVTFHDARDYTLEACRNMIGAEGITDSDCVQVANAFAAVGIGDPIVLAPQPSDVSCTVALDPGHGGPDPGAQRAGIDEKDINWQVAGLVQQQLTGSAHQVVLSRSENESPSFQDRWQPAEDADADFLVSIHVNAVTDAQAHGTEAWYQPASINQQALESSRLAQLLTDSVASRANLVNRGTKEGKALYSPTIPSALIELAFLSNDDERQLLTSNPQLFANAVSEAIVSYCRSIGGAQPPIPGGSTDTVMVFDTSGSMQGGKIQGAKRAGNNVLDIIVSENEAISDVTNQVGLAHFNFTAGIDAQLTADIDGARNALNRMNADGGTAMPDGLRLGINMMDGRGGDAKPIIALLSDGLPNIGLGGAEIDESEVRRQVLDLAREAGGKGYCIYTVGFGVGGEIDEGLLREIAQLSGCGEYYSAQDVSQLANVYVQLRHASTGEIRLQQSGAIAQNQQLAIGSVDVPRGQGVLLYTLNWPGSQLDPMVVDPRGRAIDANYPNATITTKSSVATVIVNDPRSGAWQVGATGVDVPGGQTTYHAVLSTRIAPSGPASLAPLWFMLGGLGLVAGAMVLVRQQGSSWYLTVTEESGRRSQVKVGRKGVWIGRDQKNEIILSDPAVSRRHAWIGPSTRGGDELFVRDEGGRMGTKRNDKKIRQAGMSEKDVITIGETSIRATRGRPS